MPLGVDQLADWELTGDTKTGQFIQALSAKLTSLGTIPRQTVKGLAAKLLFSIRGGIQENLIPDPAFEYDTPGAGSGYWTTSATERIDGGATAEIKHPGGEQVVGRTNYIVVSTTGGTSVEGVDTGEVIPMTAGVPVTVYAYIFGPEGGGQKIELRLGPTGAEKAEKAVTLVEGFVQYSVTFTPTKNGKMGFAVCSQGTTKLKFFMTAVGTNASYFDGDSPDGEWTGTAGNSASKLNTLAKKTLKQLPASLSFLGAMRPMGIKSFAATLPSSGSLAHNILHQLTALLSFAGTLRRNIAHKLSTELSFAGKLPRSILRMLTGTLSFVGSLPRNTLHALSATLSSLGTLLKVFAITKSLSAYLSSVVGIMTRGAILDNFERENENPIAKGWAKLAEYAQAEIIEDALVEGKAYWTAGEIIEPTVVAGVSPPTEGTKEMELFACIVNPTGSNTEYTAYRAQLRRETEGLFSFTLIRKKSGESAGVTLSKAEKIIVSTGDLIGISTSSGVIKFWHKAGVGSWVIVTKANDTTFTKGYVGLGAEKTTRFYNFGTGPIVAESFPALNVNYQLSAYVTSIGTLSRNILHRLQAILEFTGSLTPKISEHIQKLVAALSFTGVFPRNTTRQSSGSLGSEGLLGKSISHALAGALSFAGSIGPHIRHPLSGSLPFNGSIASRVISRALIATLNLAGSVRGRAVKNLEAALSFAGTSRRNIRHALSAELMFSGFLKVSAELIQRFAAALSFSGKSSRSIIRTLAASVALSGLLGRSIEHRLKGSLGAAGRLQRAILHQLEGALAVSGETSRKIYLRLTASVTFVGTTSVSVLHQVRAALQFAGTLTPLRKLVQILKASLSFSGQVTRRSARVVLEGVLEFAGFLNSKLVGGLKPLTDAIVLKPEPGLPSITLRRTETGEVYGLIDHLQGFPEMEVLPIVKRRRVFGRIS